MRIVLREIMGACAKIASFWETGLAGAERKLLMHIALARTK